ncbi:MAG TPA: TIR domain-containing protein, partial [Thermoanaerobaculia bacterium]|nr:TIR domain-containing protein [Thermoanaerobaculia bacterium]
MGSALFISYSRADMQETDWLGRLKMYLAPFGRQGIIDAWDDQRIAPGMLWRDEIARALDDAAAAVLLIGPGFLASDFVMEREVPRLLRSAHDRGLALFLLLVGFSGYHATELNEYQAFNSPEEPLESLQRSEQNRILNALAIAIAESLRAEKPHASKASDGRGLYDRVLAIQRHLSDTRMAFVAQCRRRDDLVAAIERRLKFDNEMEYEKFFFLYYNQL